MVLGAQVFLLIPKFQLFSGNICIVISDKTLDRRDAHSDTPDVPLSNLPNEIPSITVSPLAENTTGKGKGKTPMPKKPKFNFYWIYGGLAILFIGIQFINFGSGSKEANWGEVKMMLEDGDIDKIVLVNKEFAEIFIKKERLSSNPKYDSVKGGNFSAGSPNYIYYITSPDKFAEKLEAVQQNRNFLAL